MSTAPANISLASDTSITPFLMPIANPDAIIKPNAIITFDGELIPMFCLIWDWIELPSPAIALVAIPAFLSIPCSNPLTISLPVSTKLATGANLLIAALPKDAAVPIAKAPALYRLASLLPCISGTTFKPPPNIFNASARPILFAFKY